MLQLFFTETVPQECFKSQPAIPFIQVRIVNKRVRTAVVLGDMRRLGYHCKSDTLFPHFRHCAHAAY